MILHNVTMFNIFTFPASFNAEKIGGGLFGKKSISGATLGSAKIFTFLASFNAEKKSVGLFEEEKVH